MQYNELQEVIKQLKKKVQCQLCNAKFTNKDIKILSTINDEGIFQLTCNHCKNEIIVHVTVKAGEGEEKNAMNITTQKHKTITHNDVLDIHNFLSKFKGDFKQLFSNKQQ